MPRETWWADDVPPIQYAQRSQRLMRLYGGFMLILGLACGIGIGYLVWGR